MEFIVRQVKDIEPGHRSWLEGAIGRQLDDNQKIVIRVLSPGVEPDAATRNEALADLKELSGKGSRHRESLGRSVDEALEEAIRDARSRMHP